MQEEYPDNCAINVVEDRFEKFHQAYLKHFFIIKESREIYDLYVQHDLLYILLERTVGPQSSRIQTSSETIKSISDIQTLASEIRNILRV